MSFITRTRLVKIATGDPPPNHILLDPPVVFRTGPQGTVVESVPEAMAFVPPGQRPPESDWWQYIVQWEVTAHLVPIIMGVIPYDLADLAVPLVVDANFWQTETQRLASDPPIVLNTFTFVFNQRPREYATTMRQIVDDWLISATFNNWTGDRRDPAQTARASKNPTDDPRGLLTNGGIVALDGVPRTLASIWRGS